MVLTTGSSATHAQSAPNSSPILAAFATTSDFIRKTNQSNVKRVASALHALASSRGMNERHTSRKFLRLMMQLAALLLQTDFII